MDILAEETSIFVPSTLRGSASDHFCNTTKQIMWFTPTPIWFFSSRGLFTATSTTTNKQYKVIFSNLWHPYHVDEISGWSWSGMRVYPHPPTWPLQKCLLQPCVFNNFCRVKSISYFYQWVYHLFSSLTVGNILRLHFVALHDYKIYRQQIINILSIKIRTYALI